MITVGSTAKWVGSQFGMGIYTPAGGSYARYRFSPTTVTFPQPPMTIVWQGFVNGDNAAGNNYFYGIDSASYACAVIGRPYNSQTAVRTSYNNNGTLVTSQVEVSMNTRYNRLLTYAVVITNASVLFYENGVLIGSYAGVTNIVYTSPAILLGGNVGGGSDGPNATALFGAVWGRALSQGEIFSLHKDPFEMFDSRWIMVYDPATGTFQVVDSDAIGHGDTTWAINATIIGSDTHTFGDVASLLATVSGSDAATLAQAGVLAASITGADSATQSSLTALLAVLAGSDAYSEAEVSGLYATLTGSDSGTSGDSGIVGGANPVFGTDSMSLADIAALIVSVTRSDAFSLAEQQSILGILTSLDTATLTQASMIVASAASGDTLHFGESSSISINGAGVQLAVVLLHAARLAANTAGSVVDDSLNGSGAPGPLTSGTVIPFHPREIDPDAHGERLEN